jgi:putative membrane protein
MAHGVWNDWYFGWGWFLWFGILMLAFSSVGNWGYTYRVHRLRPQRKEALDILDERFARGEITRVELVEMRAVISGTGAQP